MLDSDVNIRVTASGSDAASAALGDVKRSMEGIGAQHNDLVQKFGHRFEHVGLMLFAGEALRASGLGAETRQVIGTLTLALNSLAFAGGPAAQAIALIGAAFAAGVGIYQKVAEHHKTIADELEKLTESEENERVSLTGSIDKIQDYIRLGGPHEDAIRHVLDAKMKLQAFIESTEMVNYEKQIHAEALLIQEEYEHYRSLRQLEAAHNSLTYAQILSKALTGDWKESVGELVVKLHDSQKQIDETAKSILKHNVALQEAKFQYQLLADGSHKTFDQILKDMQDENQESEKTTKSKIQHMGHFHHEYSTTYDLMGDESKKFFDAQSQSFAKMVVEGKSFTDSLKNLWADMAEMFVAQVEKMIAEWLVLQMVTGGTGIIQEGSFASHIFPQASGGDYLVSSPTLFMAGEAGPERATFTPMGGGSATTNNGGDTYNIVNNFNGVTDPNAIGQKIVESIRGRGQINFTRG